MLFHSAGVPRPDHPFALIWRGMLGNHPLQRNNSRGCIRYATFGSALTRAGSEYLLADGLPDGAFGLRECERQRIQSRSRHGGGRISAKLHNYCRRAIGPVRRSGKRRGCTRSMHRQELGVCAPGRGAGTLERGEWRPGIAWRRTDRGNLFDQRNVYGRLHDPSRHGRHYRCALGTIRATQPGKQARVGGGGGGMGCTPILEGVKIDFFEFRATHKG
jgi:hypothetical protein